MSDCYEKLAKAYKVCCPIVTLTTSDPAATLQRIAATLSKSPIVSWDCARGATAVVGQPNYQRAAKLAGELGEVYNPVEALVLAAKLPEGAVLVIHNAHRFLDKVDMVQAVWNLRDEFKGQRRMLILLGPQLSVPVELQHDVIELDEPLPGVDQLRGVINDLATGAGVNVSSEEQDAGAVASVGLSAFAAEQLASLNMSKSGLSARGVWADKCHKINETPGLKVVTGGSFDDIAGVENAKQFLRRILTGKSKPNAIVYIDEIEKSIGGSSHDTSGVSQDQLGVQLQWMQDRRATGCIFVGPPGACKSAMAKAAGGEFGIPTIQLDLGGMKGSLVGESEGRIRDALKVIDAVSGGQTLWLATCNAITALPPELRRRYKYGTWFFDLPDMAERKAIWAMYCKRLEVKGPSKQLLAEEWTGAEIESCCEIADRCGISPDEAANYIVPVSKAGAAQIESLRAMADGKLLSASHEGVYTRTATTKPSVRRFDDE